MRRVVLMGVLVVVAIFAFSSVAYAKTATKISLTASSKTPAYKASVTFKIKLTTKSGKAISGQSVTLQRQSGSTWVKVKTAKTSSKGKVSISSAPSQQARTVYRVRYKGTKQRKASTSAAIAVTPKVSIAKPKGPDQWTVGQPFTVTGALLPVAPGVGTVNVYRYWGDAQDGPWTQDSVAAATLAAAAGGSLYTASVSVPNDSHMYWRFVARYEGDAQHASTWSPEVVWKIRTD